MTRYACKIEPKQHPRIIAMYANMSGAEIASKFDVTPAAIFKILAKHGVVVRDPWSKVPRKNGGRK